MYMQPWFYMLGSKKNRLIGDSTFKIPQHMIWLKTFKVFLFFLSIVTFPINSRERQQNYQKKLPCINSYFFWTIRYGQTVQTHIGLSLEKKSNQGFHCLQFCQYLSLALFDSKTFWFIFFCMITTVLKES